ncbi:unnamed protein product, partial [Amoebophrya sp. A120]
KGVHDEYTIGFTIHEVRDMLTSDGKAIDPLVVVRCAGNTYVSQKKEHKRDHVSFEESFTWSAMKMMQSQFFDGASLLFELQAGRIFWANEVLGRAIVSCPLVRSRKNHSFSRRWVDIRDGIRHRGRICVSATCYASGDQTGMDKEETESEGDIDEAMEDLNKLVINQVTDASIKAQMKLLSNVKMSGSGRAYYVVVQVHRLEGLGGLGLKSRKFNPYVEVSFAGRRLRSSVSFQTKSCNFNEGFQLPVITPLFDDSIVIKIKDYLIGRKDKVIQGRLSFSSLRNTTLSPRFFNFYSFPPEEIHNPVEFIAQTGMRSEPNEFFGRLLLSGRAQMLSRLAECQDAMVIPGGGRVDEPPQTPRRLIFDVFKASGMPGTQIFVTRGRAGRGAARRRQQAGRAWRGVEAGEKEEKDHGRERLDGQNFKEKISKGAGNRGRNHFLFKASGGNMELPVMVPDDADQQADVIISAYALFQMPAAESAGKKLSDAEMRKFKRIGYHRMKYGQLQDHEKNPERPPIWVHLLPMPHLPPLISPGAVLITLGHRDGMKRKKKEDDATANVEEEIKKHARGIDLVQFELRMGLCSCRDLATPRADGNRPNPIVEIQCGGETILSAQKKQTHQPVFVERLILDVELPKSRTSNRMSPEPIVLTEKQMNMTTKLLIGRCLAKVDAFTKPGQSTRIRPQWLELYGGVNNQTWVGDILFSAELVRKADSKLIKKTLMSPPRKPCVVQFAFRSLNEIPPVVAEKKNAEGGTDLNVLQPVQKPTLVIVVPQYSELATSGMGNTLRVDWDRTLAPKHARNTQDLTNPTWASGNSLTNFGMLEVHALYVEFPIDPIWCPI